MRENQIKYILKLPSGAEDLGEMIMHGVFSDGFVVEDLPEGSVLFTGYEMADTDEKSRLWNELQSELESCSEEILRFGGYLLRREKEEKLDWLEEWKDSFKTHRVGEDWIIIPSWEAETFAGDENRHPLFIEPGVAFGSGNHPTTRLALKNLSLLASDITEYGSFLDAGSGSGIISIAAARLGFSPITAVDIDELSVENTRKNLKLNGLEDSVEVIAGDICHLADDLRRADLIVINCLPRVIEEIFHRLDELLLPGGLAIVSGFKAKHSNMIENLLKEVKGDFCIHSRKNEADWRSFTVRKAGDR